MACSCLLYVLDGPPAGRMGLTITCGTAIFFAITGIVIQYQLDSGSLGGPESLVYSTSLASFRLTAASIIALLCDIVCLGVLWELLQKNAIIPLLAKIVVTLLVVFSLDVFVYIFLTTIEEEFLWSKLRGAVYTRAAVALLFTPIIYAYFIYEMRRFGVVFTARPVFSIVIREDLERELATARHRLLHGTEALWVSEERYRTVVEDIPVLVFRFSPDGRVTYANPSVNDYYHSKSVVGSHVFDAILKSQRKEAWAILSELSPSDPTRKISVTAFPKPDERREQDWTVRAIFSSTGVALAYQAIGEDVTLQRQLEARIAQAQKMEVVGMLAGGIAHDFANLSMVFSIGTTNARTAIKAGDEIRVERILDDLSEASEQALSLTNQVMGLSHNREVSPELVDVAVILKSLKGMLSHLLASGAKLKLEIEDGLPSALIDPSRLKRVLANLVVNADQALKSDGTVTLSIELGVPTIYGLSSTPMLILKVQDNGCGMDEKTIGRVFEPFFSTKSDKGTGFGLATAYNIVTMANGHIEVDSELGVGTCFTIFLPTAD